MRFAFRAIQGFFEDDGEVLAAGVDTGDNWDEEDGHYLSFQRDADGHRHDLRDWEKDGLHFEFDDQSHGDYGVVRRCRLSRSMLSIDLSESIEGFEEVEGFDVELAIDDESFEQLRTGLPRVLQGTLAQLLME